jgi:DsbC/DsbD-like thiol-disulfide interchange protein
MKLILILSLAAGSAAACSSSRTSATPAPVVWTIAPPARSIGPGATSSVRVDAKIQDGWHIYSVTQPAGGPIATRISVPTGQPFIAAGSPVPSAPPRMAFDDAFHMNVEMHEKAVAFNVPVRSTATAVTAAGSVHVNVRYQVCNETLCLPPQTAKLATSAPAGAGR